MTYRPYNAIKATGFEFQYTNSSGSTITRGTPVRIMSTGNVDFVDVSVESEVFALGGVVSEDSLNGQVAKVVTAGRVENITTTAVFGDAVYLSKSGGLTTSKPSVGVDGFVSGDFVVRVGTIAKNETNGSLKDLILELRLVGQLGL